MCLIERVQERERTTCYECQRSVWTHMTCSLTDLELTRWHKGTCAFLGDCEVLFYHPSMHDVGHVRVPRQMIGPFLIFSTLKKKSTCRSRRKEESRTPNRAKFFPNFLHSKKAQHKTYAVDCFDARSKVARHPRNEAPSYLKHHGFCAKSFAYMFQSFHFGSCRSFPLTFKSTWQSYTFILMI